MSKKQVNKSDLVGRIAARTGIDISMCDRAVNSIIETMTDALASGGSVEIRGFASFTPKEYGAYTGRNPKTGEKIQIAGKILPVCKIGKELREAVDNAK